MGNYVTTYCLKDIVSILPFDNYEDNRFILSCGKRNWNVALKIKIIADIISTPKTFDEIWDELCKQECSFTKEEVDNILTNQFYANGWIENSESTSANITETLWGRFTIVPKSILKYFSIFVFLFSKAALLPVLLIIAAVNIFVICNNGIDTNIIDKISAKNIILFISLNGVLVLFHEIGHVVAMMKYGYLSERIGGAFYMWRPVMFSDVTSCWKLKRNQRQCVNLGGIYFQLILSTVFIFIAYLCKFSDVVDLIIYSYLSVLNNFNVFIKTDGYWVFSDFLGVSNFHDCIINLILRREKKSFSLFKKIILYVYAVLFIFVVAFLFYVLSTNFVYACVNIHKFINGDGIGIEKLIYSLFILLLNCIFIFKMAKKIIVRLSHRKK